MASPSCSPPKGVSSLDFRPPLEGGFFLSRDAAIIWVRSDQQAKSFEFCRVMKLNAWRVRGRSTSALPLRHLDPMPVLHGHAYDPQEEPAFRGR